ncbi:DUF1501 domain-containing protein [Musicola paradisiaca]|uniref:DUF1501 domain-containing protein n=1 Tax=Musicola paradisiaca (strain Ech703) TaxID=579405 RepID=C6C709_MUSP7|nr:DUF1501 domain-containing protein [Musicola paradisiaca]ACS85903.1 protein of unknown function DUF1501 [Musicola paradisiaca Ech703]
MRSSYRYSRRELLKLFGGVSLLSLLPGALQANAPQDISQRIGARRLIIVELFGGNDALNTLIPYRDPLYAHYRPTLSLPVRDVIPLNDELALHPALKTLNGLFQSGEMAIVQEVGYPNNSLSHFDSTTIWGTAITDAAVRSGWVGRVVRDNPRWAEKNDADGIILSGSNIFMDEKGVRPLEIQDAKALLRPAYGELNTDHLAVNPSTEYLSNLLKNHRLISDRIRQKLKGDNSFERLFKYPGQSYLEPLYVQAAQLLWLIDSGVETPVFKIGLSGFDLHTQLAQQHGPLLASVERVLLGLRQGLKAMGVWDNTLILVQSEFGRRPAENASGGTDHGSSGVVLLLGGSLEGGLYGTRSGLETLDGVGNPYFTTDFRTIYSSIVSRFWRLPENPLAAEGFPPMAFRL